MLKMQVDVMVEGVHVGQATTPLLLATGPCGAAEALLAMSDEALAGLVRQGLLKCVPTFVVPPANLTEIRRRFAVPQT